MMTEAEYEWMRWVHDVSRVLFLIKYNEDDLVYLDRRDDEYEDHAILYEMNVALDLVKQEREQAKAREVLDLK